MHGYSKKNALGEKPTHPIIEMNNYFLKKRNEYRNMYTGTYILLWVESNLHSSCHLNFAGAKVWQIIGIVKFFLFVFKELSFLPVQLRIH